MHNIYIQSDARSEHILQNSKDDLTVCIIQPSLSKNKHVFFGLLFSKRCSVLDCKVGKSYYKEFQLVKNNKIVAVAEVVSWIPILPFMPKDALYIGACVTAKEERGNGYYPYLLCQIQDNFPDKELYIVVDDNNKASMRGVEKAGFRCVYTGRKTRFGRYVVD